MAQTHSQSGCSLLNEAHIKTHELMS